MSSDAQELIIVNRKPLNGKETYGKYLISPDGQRVRVDEPEGLLKQDFTKKFNDIKSEGSCKISEIESFVVGG